MAPPLRQQQNAPEGTLRPWPARGVSKGALVGEKLPGRTARAGKAEAPARIVFSSRCSRTPLTRRELRILAMICNGDINREIALEIRLSADGVKYHLRKIFGKLGVNRRAHAIAVAVHTGLIAPDWLSSRSGARS